MTRDAVFADPGILRRSLLGAAATTVVAFACSRGDSSVAPRRSAEAEYSPEEEHRRNDERLLHLRAQYEYLRDIGATLAWSMHQGQPTIGLLMDLHERNSPITAQMSRDRRFASAVGADAIHQFSPPAFEWLLVESDLLDRESRPQIQVPRYFVEFHRVGEAWQLDLYAPFDSAAPAQPLASWSTVAKSARIASTLRGVVARVDSLDVAGFARPAQSQASDEAWPKWSPAVRARRADEALDAPPNELARWVDGRRHRLLVDLIPYDVEVVQFAYAESDRDRLSTWLERFPESGLVLNGYVLSIALLESAPWSESSDPLVCEARHFLGEEPARSDTFRVEICDHEGNPTVTAVFLQDSSGASVARGLTFEAPFRMVQPAGGGELRSFDLGLARMRGDLGSTPPVLDTLALPELSNAFFTPEMRRVDVERELDVRIAPHVQLDDLATQRLQAVIDGIQFVHGVCQWPLLRRIDIVRAAYSNATVHSDPEVLILHGASLRNEDATEEIGIHEAFHSLDQRLGLARSASVKDWFGSASSGALELFDERAEHWDRFFAGGHAHDSADEFVVSLLSTATIGLRSSWPLHRAGELDRDAWIEAGVAELCSAYERMPRRRRPLYLSALLLIDAELREAQLLPADVPLLRMLTAAAKRLEQR